jgi:thioredoxin-like negative regulator of GroEL
MQIGDTGIQGIPTLLLFKDGTHIERLVGALPKPELERRPAFLL